MRRFPFILIALAALAASVTQTLFAEDGPSATVVLDTSGFWRVRTMLKPPVVRGAQGVKRPSCYCNTEPPAKDWMRADFDDTRWVRLPGAPFASHNSWSVVSKHNVGFVTMEYGSTCTALICMRGKFNVTDPARVKDLKVALAYRGGIVVYLNGTEIARGHLPKGPIQPTTLAQKYPLEAYVKPDGSLLQCDQGEKRKDVIARWELRTRKLDDVTVPARLLRKGVNVLAIEVHRSPYQEVLPREVAKFKRDHERPRHLWSTCGLVSARLTARNPDGLMPNVVRPKGVQVWNSPSLMADFDMDHGDLTEPSRCIGIVGTRGGHFSGKVVVGSDRPIHGITAAVSNLKQTNGRGLIAAGRIRIRYALPTSTDPGVQRRYAAHAALFDGLSGKPPEEVPVREKKWVRGNWVRPAQPVTVFGAVVPVWVTVDVPTDAPPGDYAGTLTIKAKDVQPIRIPVELKVCGWTLPPAAAFRTVVDFVQSPESVAIRYNVPLWSDRHFQLIEKSFDCLGEVGNWTVYLPLICRTNQGNEQSMVRWIRRPDGTYTHDFSILERYLDLAIKHMGKPRIVVIYAWDVFLGGGYREIKEGREVPVSLLDAKTGKVSLLELPPYHDPKSAALWKPLAEGLRRRLVERGLESTATLGISTDSQPSPAVVNVFKECLPGVPWMRHGHSQRRDTRGVPIAYQCLVWTPKFVSDPKGPPLRGWSRPENWTQFCRSRGLYPVLIARLLGEMNIQGAQRGFGRIGLDFWPVLKNKRGRRAGSIQGRFPVSNWRNLDWMIHDFLPAGPDGALASTRLLMMREGLQECEARIFIENALTDDGLRKKLGDDLARRCEELIAERTRAVTIGLENHLLCGFGRTSTAGHSWWSTPGQVGQIWYLGSGWQERSQKLYRLATDVTHQLNRKK